MPDRVWRRETTDGGYAIIRECHVESRERIGNGRWKKSTSVLYWTDEFYSDGSRKRNSPLAWSPTLESAKRQYREWGFSTGVGRWVEVKNAEEA